MIYYPSDKLWCALFSYTVDLNRLTSALIHKGVTYMGVDRTCCPSIFHQNTIMSIFHISSRNCCTNYKDADLISDSHKHFYI